MLETLERSRLSELETVIEGGLRTFVDVGMALAEIQRDKLYRETHGTFEDYCRVKWSISRPRAYELIGGAKAVSEMSAIADKPITPVANEGQARELAKIKDPEIRTQVWDLANKAAEATKTAVTAKLVKEAVTTLDSYEKFQSEPKPELEVIEVRHYGSLSREIPAAPSDDGLELHGILMDLETKFLRSHINTVIAGMTPSMRDEMRVLIPQTVNWLNSYE